MPDNIALIARSDMPVYHSDFFSGESILDPPSVYKVLRELGPVVWMAQHNCYALPRYAETTNDQLFISSKGVSLLEETNKRLGRSTLNSDNPRHDMTRAVTADIIELAFKLDDASAFNTPEPGAHIDIKLPSGLVRQYSLHTVDSDGAYSVAVLNDADSRGGSREVHAALQAGAVVQISAPRNHFPLLDTAGCSYLLAGGIGVTPIKAMAETLKTAGDDYQVLYFGHDAERMAYIDALQQAHGERLTIVTDRAGFDLQAVLANASLYAQLYTCGPNGFMDYVFESAQQVGWSEAQLHKEYFGAEISTEGDAFNVEAQRSGISFTVEPGETIVGRLKEQGIYAPMSCQSGVCGTKDWMYC